MKDIKTKEHDRTPKMRNPASRLPKELAKVTLLQAKEKSHQVSSMTESGMHEQSPTEYGSEKITSAEEWTGSKAGAAVHAGAKKLTVKTREKIKERKAEASFRKEEQSVEPRASADSVSISRPLKQDIHKPLTEPVGESKSAVSSGIRIKPEQRELLHPVGKRAFKEPARYVKAAQAGKRQVAAKALSQRQQAAIAAKSLAVQSAKNVEASANTTKSTIKVTAKGIRATTQAVIVAAKSIWAAVAAGGAGIILVLILMMGIIAGAVFSGYSSSAQPLSAEVLSYTATIQRYASQYQISEYVSVIQAIMMQESGGRGTDPMQSSECPYNTRYGHSPNSITDPDYSIQVGIQYYADCVQEAQCTNPYDMDRLKLSLQGYNYGNGYITWAVRNYGGYSAANALQFSQEQAASHGWANYGDPEYVPHVLQYYSGGGLFDGLFGNEQVVSIAKAQLGNVGGQKFWSWYGFDGRVEWCACFVSWCADQSGLIQSGAIPKFALCSAGVNWFKAQNRWQENTHTPTAGTIIFFDWGGDGVSDHVGIVEKCESGIVYTVEGNSSDAVNQRQYAVGAGTILGYGIINK